MMISVIVTSQKVEIADLFALSLVVIYLCMRYEQMQKSITDSSLQLHSSVKLS